MRRIGLTVAVAAVGMLVAAATASADDVTTPDPNVMDVLDSVLGNGAPGTPVPPPPTQVPPPGA
jgi:hypothetical protein